MNFFDSLVGPVPKSYCFYFYIATLLSFFAFVVALFACLGLVFKKKETFNFNHLNLIVYPLFAYFINRIYYNMCLNSL